MSANYSFRLYAPAKDTGVLGCIGPFNQDGVALDLRNDGCWGDILEEALHGGGYVRRISQSDYIELGYLDEYARLYEISLDLPEKENTERIVYMHRDNKVPDDEIEDVLYDHIEDTGEPCILEVEEYAQLRDASKEKYIPRIYRPDNWMQTKYFDLLFLAHNYICELKRSINPDTYGYDLSKALIICVESY